MYSNTTWQWHLIYILQSSPWESGEKFPGIPGNMNF